MVRHLLLLSALAACAAPIALAQGVPPLPGERFENWLFNAPQGWDRREDDDGLSFTSPDGQASMRLLRGEGLSSAGLDSWLAGQIVLQEQNLTLVNAENRQTTPTSDHYEWITWPRGLRDRQGRVFVRAYIAASPRARAELLVFTAFTLEAFERHSPVLARFIDSAQFANVRGIPKPAPSPLPSIPAPSANGLAAARLSVEPIADEFRCYFSRESDDYSTPDFFLQILPGQQYRTADGTGSFTVVQNRTSRSGAVEWRSGPLATRQGAASPSFATAGWQDDGQVLLLANAPLRRRGGLIDANCYQRGARETRAKAAFARLDPRPGSYACVTQYREDPAGTLEILPGRRYRYGGGEGAYSVDVMHSQMEPNASLKFFGGPFGFGSGTYSDNPPGRQRYSVSSKVSLVCAAKP
jgi:hypothetical protein